MRIDSAKHGDPLYFPVWEAGARSGYVIKADPSSQKGIRAASVQMENLLEFETRGHAGQCELETCFAA